jgi:signal transduction histidine kinase
VPEEDEPFEQRDAAATAEGRPETDLGAVLPLTGPCTTLADLTGFDAVVDVGTPGQVVTDLLKQDPELPGVIVTDRGLLKGIISRALLFDQLSRPFGNDLYRKRSIAYLLAHVVHEPLVLDAGDGLDVAVSKAIDRPAEARYEPVVIRFADGRLELLDVERLMLALARAFAERSRENEALLLEVERRAESVRMTLDDLRRTQDHLVEARKMAALGQLVAGVAHEINTPVGICVTAASHLREKTEEIHERLASGELKKSQLTAYLETAEEAGCLLLSNLTRAADLIRSFKDVAADQTSETRRRIHLRQYLEAILFSLRPRLKRTPHAVIVDCPDDLEMESYPGAIAQVLTNLVINSLTHAFPNGTAGHIRISARAVDGDVEVRHEDDGMGIPEDHLERIFEPFFTTRLGSGGTGLGLHIVYNLVTRRLGGCVTCDSKPGRGTSFIIRVPAVFSGTLPLSEGDDGSDART